MLLNQSHDRVRNPAPRFLLGAGCGALLVLSFAGAGLALSGSGTERWKPGVNELRLNVVPQSGVAPRRLS